MKVLSDWQTGTPPMPGVWLVRYELETLSHGELCSWGNDHCWRLGNGNRVYWAGKTMWRGLAFDPEAATYCYGYTGGADAWIVTEPKP